MSDLWLQIKLSSLPSLFFWPADVFGWWVKSGAAKSFCAFTGQKGKNRSNFCALLKLMFLCVFELRKFSHKTRKYGKENFFCLMVARKGENRKKKSNIFLLRKLFNILRKRPSRHNGNEKCISGNTMDELSLTFSRKLFHFQLVKMISRVLDVKFPIAGFSFDFPPAKRKFHLCKSLDNQLWNLNDPIKKFPRGFIWLGRNLSA